MNVVIIPSWFASKKNPLSGSFFKEQAIAIAKNNHNVYLLDCSYQGREGYFLKSNFRIERSFENNVHILKYTTPAFGISRRKNPQYKSYERKLEKLLKIVMNEVDIDIVHSHSYLPAGFISGSLCKKYNLPHIMTEHSSTFISNHNINESRLIQTVKNCVYVIAVGKRLQDKLIDITKEKEKIVFIPNIVSDSFQYKPLQAGEKFNFLSVGNVDERKNFKHLIDAFNLAFNKNLDVSLTIVGDGPLKRQLVDYVNEINIGKQVSFVGLVPREEIHEYFENSHSFVLVSKAETFGVVYVEALAAGRPIIGLENGGAEYIINNKNGIIVREDTVEEIKKALVSMYSDFSKYDLELISKNAKEIYGGKVIIEKLEKLYHQILTNHK